MGNLPQHGTLLPEWQQAIRARCMHPSGAFVAFDKADIEQSIPARFEQMVTQYPDRLAVKSKHQTLAYAALKQWANRIAHAILARCGTGAASVAMVCGLDATMIATLMGILKAGKIVVPLDPLFPQQRLGTLLADSQARLIVTDRQHSDIIRPLAQGGVQVLNIDALEHHLADTNPGLPISPARASKLALCRCAACGLKMLKPSGRSEEALRFQ